MSRPWFRLYHEFASDPKVQLLAFEDQRHFIVLLCLKCNETLDSKATSIDLRERMIAKALGLDPSAASEVKRRLQEAGLIDANWQPKQWDSRQFESDTSTKRTASYRQKLKNKRHSDGDVTSQERTRSDTEQIQNRTEDLSAQPPDGLDTISWNRWIQYRTEIRKPLKQVSMPAAQRKLAAFGKDQLAVVEQSIANGWQGLFELKANGLVKVNGCEPARRARMFNE